MMAPCRVTALARELLDNLDVMPVRPDQDRERIRLRSRPFGWPLDAELAGILFARQKRVVLDGQLLKRRQILLTGSRHVGREDLVLHRGVVLRIAVAGSAP